MSEHGPKPEIHKHHEKLVHPEHLKHAEKTIHKKAEQARHAQGAENLKILQELAQQQAETSHKTPIEEVKDQEPDNWIGMQQSLKSKAYERTLKSVQQKLPPKVRIFSHVTHNKTVEAISSAGAKTVARPSGLLGGSICAFIGSVVLLYYSKHYGFTYNYALFLILFVGGFLIGASIELVIWALHKRKHGSY